MIDLPPGKYQLGTGRGADIQLRDKGVGFKHAELTITDQEVVLEDFKSKGGTFVNGTQLEPGERVQLADGHRITLGSAELMVSTGAPAAASPPAPVAAEPEPEPVAVEPEPVAVEPEPVAVEPDPVAVEPEPVAVEPEPAAAREPEDQAELARVLASGDVQLLRQTVQDLSRRLSAKSQEADALLQALEAQGPGDGAGGALASYDAGLDQDYAEQLRGLEYQLQEEAARVVEQAEVIASLQSRIEDQRQKHQDELRRREGEQSSVAESLEKAYTEIARLKKTLEKETNLEQLEEANAQLLDENETLKEELSGLKFQMEEEQSRRGELVRDRVSELRQEAQRMEESNAELRTLVEAYEEKIDELDERLEELEGENEALQALVGELREELSKTKKERETMVKTLRKKLKAMELKLDETRAAQARSDSEQKQAV